MTQQYLAGELSLLLAQLQAATANQAFAGDFAHLRREAETRPLGALATLAVRALAVSDGACWDSLTRADAIAFARQAALSAELHEFGVCASLLDDD